MVGYWVPGRLGMYVTCTMPHKTMKVLIFVLNLFQFPYNLLLPSWTQVEPKEIRGEYLLKWFFTHVNWRLCSVLMSPLLSAAGRSGGERLCLLPEEGGLKPVGDAGGAQKEEEEEVRAIKAPNRNSSTHPPSLLTTTGGGLGKRTKLYSSLLVNYRMVWSQKDAALPLGPPCSGNTVEGGEVLARVCPIFQNQFLGKRRLSGKHEISISPGLSTTPQADALWFDTVCHLSL